MRDSIRTALIFDRSATATRTTLTRGFFEGTVTGRIWPPTRPVLEPTPGGRRRQALLGALLTVWGWGDSVCSAAPPDARPVVLNGSFEDSATVDAPRPAGWYFLRERSLSRTRGPRWAGVIFDSPMPCRDVRRRPSSISRSTAGRFGRSTSAPGSGCARRRRGNRLPNARPCESSSSTQAGGKSARCCLVPGPARAAGRAKRRASPCRPRRAWP